MIREKKRERERGGEKEEERERCYQRYIKMKNLYDG